MPCIVAPSSWRSTSCGLIARPTSATVAVRSSVMTPVSGSTEISAVTFCTSEEWLAHPGTVGRPWAETDVRVIDADGNVLPAGEVGEGVARTRSISDFTYHGDDQKRRDSEKAGLIAPVDIGYFDQDGFLYLCDRAKDMIISGGVNIYPAEIEGELLKMPGVSAGLRLAPRSRARPDVCSIRSSKMRRS